MCSDTPSRPLSRRRRARLALLVAAALVLPLAVAGCGKKGDPLPPLRTVPLPTRDLQVRQEGRLMLLQMSYPATTVGGQALGGVDAVELWALSKPPQADGTPPSAEAREMEAGGEVILTLRGTDLRAATVGDRLEIRLPLADPLPEEPVASIFAVRTLKGEETSDFSNRVGLVPGEPPAPPRDLALDPRPKAVVLSWQWPDDEDPVAFDVFRRLAQERGYGQRLFQVPGDSRRYIDGNARFGERYIYTVRAVGSQKPLVYSDPAAEIEIHYEDRFAPPLPKNFVALAERGSVRLRWDPSDADDIAGYVVWRRDPARDTFARVTPEPVAGTEYVDRGLASGLRFEYRLTVIDRAGNESEPSEPVAATTR